MPDFRQLLLCGALMILSLSSNAQKIGLLLGSFVSDRWYLDQKHFSDRVQELGGVCVVDIAYNASEQYDHAVKLIDEGVDVLVLVPIDARKASDIVTYAKKRHVPVVAYDRLVLSNDISIYISYDNEKVGRLQAEYMVKKFPTGKYFLINGPTIDYNAVLFRKGQFQVLEPYIERGEIEILEDCIMDTWSEINAFEKATAFISKTKTAPDVVIAANDVLANGVLSALPPEMVGKVLITGQDADFIGIRNILSGHQAMTVYKPIQELAFKAAELSVRLANNQEVKGTSTMKIGLISIPAILLDPMVVDIHNYKETVVSDGHVSLSEVVRNLGKAFEAERNRTQLSLLQKEKSLEIQQKKNQFTIFFVITAFFLFSLAGLFYTIYHKQKDNKLLNDQKVVIEKKNRELHEFNQKLQALNEELVQQKEEISSQRDAIGLQKDKLEEVNSIIARQKDEIQHQNEHLEVEVSKRTQELIEYIRQLEQYSFVTAHNLRAPVARIIGLANLVKMQHSNPQEVKFIIDKLVITSEELDLVFKELNAILDIRTFSMEIFSSVDIVEAVNNIQSNLKSELDNSHATIQTEISVPTIFSIKPYIESILFNLLSNAIKYRDPERQSLIKIKTEKRDGRFLLSVSDNGLGIDLNYMDKIFQLYKRFHFHVEGRGIGLFLVKTQVDSLGGDIEIESQVNKGTTVKIWLDNLNEMENYKIEKLKN
jgi:D-xylose transport system substrate-binding protein